MWAVVASSGLALVIGAVIATVTAFGLAWIVDDADRPAQAVIDRRAVALAGHTGDVATAEAGLADADPGVRATALGALERLGVPRRRPRCGRAFADPDPAVRRRAVEIAARHPDVALLGPLLADADPAVVEVAAWACGEHEQVSDDDARHRSSALAGGAARREPLVREAAVAALGAIGDDRGLDAILAATTDRPAIRRRAVLALAPFVDPDHPRAAEVAAALERAARPTATGRSARPPRTSPRPGGQSGYCRRSSRRSRSRCAGTGGWPPPASGGWSG